MNCGQKIRRDYPDELKRMFFIYFFKLFLLLFLFYIQYHSVSCLNVVGNVVNFISRVISSLFLLFSQLDPCIWEQNRNYVYNDAPPVAQVTARRGIIFDFTIE